MWERNDDADTVALYVRRHVEAEAPGASASLTGRVMSMADALGLSMAGMRANRWRLSDAPPSTAGRKQSSRAKASRSARDRFSVVDGGAAS